MEFGHHPDAAVDFCLEVEAIENDLTDRAAGLQPQIADIEARIDRAMQFKVGGDTGAVVAKNSLRTIEQAFKAGAACGVGALPKCKDCPGRASLMCCENKPPSGVTGAPAPNLRELALEACQALLTVHFDHMGGVCGDPDRCWNAAKALYDAVNAPGVDSPDGRNSNGR